MAVRFCNRQPAHSASPIFGICIEESCEDSPLACRLCVSQFHQGHLIISLNYLQVRCQNTQIPPKLNDLIRKFSQMGEQLQKQAERSSNHVVEAASRIFENIYNQVPFSNILANSLKLAHIPQLIKYITSSKTYCPETMKSIVPLLRDFYFSGGYDLSSINKEREQTANQLLDLFIQAQSSIMAILANLQENIFKYSRQRIEVQQDVVKQEEICSTFLKNHQTQQMVPQIAVKEEEESQKTEQEQHRDILKRFNLARNSGKQGQIVILRETCECQIDTVIQYIDVTKIRELTLSNNAFPIVIDSKGIDHISKMVELRVLRLFWAQNLKDVDACRMTKNMTELRELCLSEFDDCSKMLVSAMKVNNPKLKKICFSMDMYHLVRYTEQNIEFIPDSAYQFEHEQTWISLTSGLSDLTTLELHHPENKLYWTSYIRQNAKKLTEFTLSNINQSKSGNKIKEYSYTPLFKVMENCASLKCLRLQQIHLDDKILVKVIQKNPKLVTFMANECPCITNKTYAIIAGVCTQMEELSIQMDDKFNIQTIASMTSLKTLVLRGCWGFKEDKFVEAISKMIKIKCLSIDYNYEWLTGKTLKAIGKLPNLKVLNISGNNLTTEDIQALSHVPYLNTIICHNNNFKYSDLTSLSLAKSLKKLSIGHAQKKEQKKISYEDIDMGKVVKAFPSLSHLKLKGFKNIQPEFLSLLPRIICLTVVDIVKEDLVKVQQYCRENEIYLNQNEEQ